MADYLPLISRAVAGLHTNNSQNRQSLYERARTALLKQLSEVVPPLAEADIERERLSLEEAIRQVEAQHKKTTQTANTQSKAEEPLIQVGNTQASLTHKTVGKIFISYRRDDSAGHAGRVHDRLSAEFGRDLLFMDVDAIPLGSNFVKVLKDEVGRCDALLAVIGTRWLGARNKDGRRRLDDPSDFVRVEISTALQRSIPVIPILLEGVSVPSSSDLPMDMKELSSRNALDVRHASFHQDMDKLIRFLRGR